MPILLAKQNPKNVATTWSQTCGRWRGASGVCPGAIFIYTELTSGFWPIIGAITGGWISGSIGTNCAGSDAYVTLNNNSPTSGLYGFNIDVWKALADGLWSSSVAFSYYTYSTGANGPYNLFAQPSSSASPGSQFKSIAGTVGAAGSCASSFAVKATLTVFDDGTFTLA